MPFVHFNVCVPCGEWVEISLVYLPTRIFLLILKMQFEFNIIRWNCFIIIWKNLCGFSEIYSFLFFFSNEPVAGKYPSWFALLYTVAFAVALLFHCVPDKSEQWKLSENFMNFYLSTIYHQKKIMTNKSFFIDNIPRIIQHVIIRFPGLRIFLVVFREGLQKVQLAVIIFVHFRPVVEAELAGDLQSGYCS